MSDMPSTKIDASGLRVAIIAGRFNEEITKRLMAGAKEALRRAGATGGNVLEMWVPGAWELPLAAKAAAESGKYDAIVALGCVIRGETSHHLYVGGEAARGLATVSLETGVPIGFGVLTTETEEQAMERSGGSAGNKGEDAAMAAVEMVLVLRRIKAVGAKGRA